MRDSGCLLSLLAVVIVRFKITLRKYSMSLSLSQHLGHSTFWQICPAIYEIDACFPPTLNEDLCKWRVLLVFTTVYCQVCVKT